MNEHMIPSSACLELIRESEGLKLSRYTDVAGYETIGYGHKIGKHEQIPDCITKEEAEGLLIADASLSAKFVRELVKVDLTQGQFDALTDFVYNLGPRALENSTLLRELNAGNYQCVPEQLERWVIAAGERMPGLCKRRKAEADLWLGLVESETAA